MAVRVDLPPPTFLLLIPIIEFHRIRSGLSPGPSAFSAALSWPSACSGAAQVPRHRPFDLNLAGRIMRARPCWTLRAGLLLLLAAPEAEGGCAALGRCCAGRSMACVSAGWRADGSHGPCYCDQACPYTLDCCHDYRQVCPVISCVVSEWSEWSSCAETCKAAYRVRRRRIIQEPRNGGEACPPLEDKAGCFEYWTREGTECKQPFIPALITTGGYGKARRKRAVSIENERAGYCVEFQLMAITEGCLRGNSSYTHWMKYLSEGHLVCVECQPPALDSRNLHCSGDGSGAKKNQLLHWQAVGNPRCRGTWKRVRQLHTCSCPSVHSFLFI